MYGGLDIDRQNQPKHPDFGVFYFHGGMMDSTLPYNKCYIYPRCSLMVFLPPLYNQLPNEQGIGVENLFIPIFYQRELQSYISQVRIMGAIPPYINT